MICHPGDQIHLGQHIVKVRGSYQCGCQTVIAGHIHGTQPLLEAVQPLVNVNLLLGNVLLQGVDLPLGILDLLIDGSQLHIHQGDLLVDGLDLLLEGNLSLLLLVHVLFQSIQLLLLLLDLLVVFLDFLLQLGNGLCACRHIPELLCTGQYAKCNRPADGQCLEPLDPIMLLLALLHMCVPNGHSLLIPSDVFLWKSHCRWRLPVRQPPDMPGSQAMPRRCR